VHRLGRFAEAFPEIELRVSATLHHVDFAREDIDLAVRHGDGQWTGLHLTRLCSEELFPVCSPRLATDARPLNQPADLLGFPLLHLDDRTTWATWLETAGVGDAEALHGPVLNRASMVIDAAVDGQGVTLARTTLAAWDLINGRLIRPFALALPLAKSYWIVGPKASAALPKIVTFREWLLAEAADDARRIAALDA
jgi:LysR family glycine cleavage system transcriptional activator